MLYTASFFLCKKQILTNIFDIFFGALSLWIWYNNREGKSEHIQAAYPLLSEGNPPDKKERRVIPMYVTHSDLIQIGILLVALAGLIYEILKGRK